jgi:predicted ester cyclase
MSDSRDLVARLVEIVNAGEVERLEEVASGEVAEAARRWIGPFRESFPDFRMELVEAVAEPDKVAAYFKCSGTQTGEWQGRPPSGRRFEGIDEVYIFRVADGKLAGAIAVVEDNLTRMRQLGLVD